MWFLDYQASCSIKHTSSHFICIKFYFKLPSTDKTREKKWELRNLITGWGWIGCCKIQKGCFYFTTIYWQLDKAQILGTLSTLATQLSFNNEYPHQFNPHLLYSLSLSLADSMPYKNIPSIFLWQPSMKFPNRMRHNSQDCPRQRGKLWVWLIRYKPRDCWIKPETTMLQKPKPMLPLLCWP